MTRMPIKGLREAYTPMTAEEQKVCEIGLIRIAEGRTRGEDIVTLQMDRRYKRWKPSEEIIRKLGATPRIIYRVVNDTVYVIHMESRTNQTYENVENKLNELWGKIK